MPTYYDRFADWPNTHPFISTSLAEKPPPGTSTKFVFETGETIKAITVILALNSVTPSAILAVSPHHKNGGKWNTEPGQ